jgi:hypothetical protein
MRWAIRPSFGTSPLPHPATHGEYADWVAGRASGLEPCLVQPVSGREADP